MARVVIAPWQWAALGAAAVGVVRLGARPAAAATAVAPPAPGAVTPPAADPPALRGVAVQTRPLPEFDGTSDAAHTAVATVAQQQLNALGYGPLVVDGIDGPATATALAAFLVDYPPTADQQAAYASLFDGRAGYYELDDVVRLGAGLDAGAAPSGQLFGPARHRRIGR